MCVVAVGTSPPSWRRRRSKCIRKFVFCCASRYSAQPRGASTLLRPPFLPKRVVGIVCVPFLIFKFEFCVFETGIRNKETDNK